MKHIAMTKSLGGGKSLKSKADALSGLWLLLKSHYGFQLANDLFITLNVQSIGLRSLCLHDHFIDKYLCKRWQMRGNLT